jgi:hypothetical protein
MIRGTAGPGGGQGGWMVEEGGGGRGGDSYRDRDGEPAAKFSVSCESSSDIEGKATGVPLRVRLAEFSLKPRKKDKGHQPTPNKTDEPHNMGCSPLQGYNK